MTKLSSSYELNPISGSQNLVPRIRCWILRTGNGFLLNGTIDEGVSILYGVIHQKKW